MTTEIEPSLQQKQIDMAYLLGWTNIVPTFDKSHILGMPLDKDILQYLPDWSRDGKAISNLIRFTELLAGRNVEYRMYRVKDYFGIGKDGYATGFVGEGNRLIAPMRRRFTDEEEGWYTFLRCYNVCKELGYISDSHRSILDILEERKP